ncbi:hypothetical protein Tco_1339957 [Tanacetum coccineum]
MLTSAPAVIASMNSLVPDLAMLLTSPGHSNSAVNNGQGVGGLVWDDVDEKLRSVNHHGALYSAVIEPYEARNRDNNATI